MSTKAAADRLRAAGRHAETEPIRVWPRWGIAQALACAIAVVGSVVAVSRPGLGFLIVLTAVLCSILEATGVTHVVRRLTGSTTSLNAWSPGADERPGLLLLVATADVPRAAAFERVARRLGDPWLFIDGAMLAILLCCALRILGFEGNGLTGVQFLLTLIPLVATPLLFDVDLSPYGAGEARAAGVDAVLRLAGELDAKLDYLDVAIVITGARAPFGQGMRAWLRRHRNAIDAKRTVVVTLEELGSGGVRWSRREGPWLLSWRTNGDLQRLCRDIADDDEGGAAFDAAPTTARRAGDAVATMARGIPAIGISTADRERVEPADTERARAFVAELARRIDYELAPRLDEQPLKPA